MRPKPESCCLTNFQGSDFLFHKFIGRSVHHAGNNWGLYGSAHEADTSKKVARTSASTSATSSSPCKTRGKKKVRRASSLKGICGFSFSCCLLGGTFWLIFQEATGTVKHSEVLRGLLPLFWRALVWMALSCSSAVGDSDLSLRSRVIRPKQA